MITTKLRVSIGALGFAVSVIVAPPLHAEMTPLMRHSLRFSQASYGAVERGSSPVRELPVIELTAEIEADIRKVDALFEESSSAMAWLVWREGKLVYERYGAPVLRRSLITSFSISKTLTGMMVGKALCEQKIKSLDDRASAYEPRLMGTAYEKNTIRSLLTMTTGVEHTGAQGGADLNALWRGEKSTIETIREKKAHNRQDSYFSRSFNYDNTATNVLGLMLRSAAGIPLSDYFSQSFYQPAGAMASARWLRDSTNEEFAMGSFLALPRDHLRVAIHLMNIIRGEEGDVCMQDYTQQLVKKAVSTSPKPPEAGTDRGYGFQIWTDLYDLPTGTVEMRGYGGQHVFMLPSASTVVLILTASDHRTDQRSLLNGKKAAKIFLRPN